MKRMLLLVHLLIYSSISSNAVAAEFSYLRLLKDHSESITNIFPCGTWKDKNKNGYYRIIYSEFLYGCSWLYIQWMHMNPNLGYAEIDYTVEIYNNDHHENIFSLPVCQETSNGILLSYKEDNGHDGHSYDVIVNIMNEVGKYSLERTPENQ
jgi:hypothetical protein